MFAIIKIVDLQGQKMIQAQLERVGNTVVLIIFWFVMYECLTKSLYYLGTAQSA